MWQLDSPCVLCHQADQVGHQSHGHPERHTDMQGIIPVEEDPVKAGSIPLLCRHPGCTRIISQLRNEATVQASKDSKEVTVCVNT